ncbi:MAG: exodeoxyribonuclease VII small subunit [Alphaproteobacteria bacterium]
MNAKATKSAGKAGPVPDDIKSMSFEDALKELETIVDRLERGEAKLDDSIRAYERGAALKRHCQARLEEARSKVEKITLASDGAPQTEPFDGDSASPSKPG